MSSEKWLNSAIFMTYGVNQFKTVLSIFILAHLGLETLPAKSEKYFIHGEHRNKV